MFCFFLKLKPSKKIGYQSAVAVENFATKKWCRILSILVLLFHAYVSSSIPWFLMIKNKLFEQIAKKSREGHDLIW